MANASSPTATILALQAPLLSLAYSLTGDRSDAYSLLRDTTERAMAIPESFASRDNLFSAMRAIFAQSYSGRAQRRRDAISSRAYALPDAASIEVTADAVPEGAVHVDHVTQSLSNIADYRQSRALTLRATGCRYSEIAQIEGISILRAYVRVVLGSMSFRAILHLKTM